MVWLCNYTIARANTRPCSVVAARSHYGSGEVCGKSWFDSSQGQCFLLALFLPSLALRHNKWRVRTDRNKVLLLITGRQNSRAYGEGL